MVSHDRTERRVSRASILGALALACGSSALLACGLVFAPGDFTESSGAGTSSGEGGAIDAPSDQGTGGSDGGSSSGDTGTSSGGVRVLLVGGRREPLNGEPSGNTFFTPETLKTTLLPSGEVGAWSFDYAPPTPSTWSSVKVMSGSVYAQASSTTVYSATFGDHITSDWTTLTLRGSTPENFQRAWMFDKGLLSAGGFAPSATTNVYFAPFNLGDGGIDPWQNLTESKLVKARGDVTLVRTAKAIYAIGGRDAPTGGANGRPEVEVAQLDPATGLPGAWEATSPLANPYTDGGTHGLVAISATTGAGYLFVVGGSLTAYNTLTDVAMAAKIDDATGKLGSWVALPKLPAATSSIGVLFANDRLYAFGGYRSASEMTDDVLAVTVQNGTIGTEWKKVGTLPSRRAGLTAVVY